MEKLTQMKEKLDTKLGDPEMYEPENKDQAKVWQGKHAEVMVALGRAEVMWMKALEKLEKAEAL